MNRFSSRHALAFGTLAVCALSVGLGISTEACSSSSPPAATNSDSGAGGVNAQCANPTLTVLFNPGYSAYIPNSMHTFQIPLGVQDVPASASADVTWVADTSKVSFTAGAIAGVPFAAAMFQTQGSGDVPIVAKYNGACGVTTLHITLAQEADWTIGNERYNNGTLLMRTTNGGLRMAVAQDGGNQASCSNCHGLTAMAANYTTVEHTPQQTGGFSDAELAAIFQQGVVPAGGYFDPSVICGTGPRCTVESAQMTWYQFHQWNVTPEQATGLVVYLRSLTPSAQTGVPSVQPRMPRMPREAGMPETGTTVVGPDADTDSAATVDGPATDDAPVATPDSASDAPTTPIGDAGGG